MIHNITRAWLAALLALFPATALGIWIGVLLIVLAGASGGSAAQLGGLIAIAAFATIYALFLAPVFSILALPFLPFARWIVRQERPYLRPGYVAVALYGPALLILFTRDWTLGAYGWAVATYEVIALGGAIGFVCFGKPLGVDLGRKPNVGAVFE